MGNICELMQIQNLRPKNDQNEYTEVKLFEDHKGEPSLDINDFVIRQKIGEGSFGKVY